MEGGFIGPTARLATVPLVAVYADGRVLLPGPTTEQFPQPLVPSVIVHDFGPAGVAAIRAAVSAAGLDRADASYPAVGVADVGDTVFAVDAAGRTVTTRFGALGPGGHGPVGPTPDPVRAAAETLLARLTDPADSWGGPATEPQAYAAPGFRIWVVPGAPQGADPSLAPAAVAWPLATPLSSFGEPAQPDRGIAGLRVGLATGADADALGPVFSAATQITPFVSGGEQFTLYVRPLLPDEVDQ
jgi:hypothetical protein